MPMSLDLRKVLFRWGQVKERAEVTSLLMFPTRDGGRWHQRNALRSYYCMTKRLGLPQWLSSTAPYVRNSILRNGGEVVRRSIILGHSDVSTTMKYLHLLTEDVQRPHQALSVLGRLRR